MKTSALIFTASSKDPLVLVFYLCSKRDGLRYDFEEKLRTVFACFVRVHISDTTTKR